MAPPTPVERCALAPGLSVSRVVTGLWQIADLERDGRSLDRAAAAAAMVPYLEAGFTTFDMADHYGSAEEIAGSFAATRPAGSRPELLTKWVPPPGKTSPDDVRAAVERSLRRLRVGTLDLLQFHAWNYADPSWLDALFALRDLQAEGLVRHLGLTNFDAAHLRIVIESGIPVVSNQVCFSLLDDRPRRRGLTRLCLEHGVKLLAYGTVAGGFLTERFLGRPEPDWEGLPTWSLLKYGRFIRAAGGWGPFQGVLAAVEKVARKHGVSVANVACRYVLEEPAVAGIIVGARLSASEHLEDNRRLFAFSLDAEDRGEIEAARARLAPLPGGSGDEYRRPPFLTASGDLRHHLEAVPAPYVPRSGRDGRTLVLSGTEWEPLAGFCRALRTGDRILVSGTTATHRDRAIGGSDPTAQTHFVIDKIEGALQSLGGRLEDVVRTRVFVKRVADWEAVARAHGERFREILPANTLVQADLVGDEYLVEIEAEAVVSPRPLGLECGKVEESVE